MRKIMSGMEPQAGFQHLAPGSSLSKAIDEAHPLFWLDLENPTEQELGEIAEAFHLHPLALEEAHLTHERPKIEDYADILFLLFYTIHLDETKNTLSADEVRVFMSEHALLTIHATPLSELAEVEQRWKRSATHLDTDWYLAVLAARHHRGSLFPTC